VQLFHRSNKVLITGGSGTGKTTYWTRLILGYRAATKFVFDSEGELAYRLDATPATSPAEIGAAIPSGWVIFDPEPMFGSDLERGFAFFSAFAFEASARLPGTKLFACDELQACVASVQTLSPELRDIMQRGRRRGLDFVGVTHQPNELNNRVRAQLTEVVSFCQVEGRALAWLTAAGFSDSDLRGLRPGEYVARNLRGRGAVRGQVF
jgi:DNA helicase HerA-like ATPase